MTAPQSAQRQVPGKAAALVITHFPDRHFPDRLDRLLEQVARVVIVDNGSDAPTRAWRERYRDRKEITVLNNPTNLGIATALNQGMNLLAREGFEWVVTLDQDSTVANGFIESLLDTIASDPNPGDVALVGAKRSDAGTNCAEHRWLRPKKGLPFFERVACDQIGPDGVTLVISSGTLTSVRAFNHLGPFRDTFFIDFVDFEYCLRARQSDYRILVSCHAQMLHHVGSKEQRSLFSVTLSPTLHSPLRRYYLFRNAVAMIRLYGWTFPHWLIYELMALAEILLGVLIFEDQKLAKLRACVLGTWDGLLRRMGPAGRSF